jgi:hypothetical protein
MKACDAGHNARHSALDKIQHRFKNESLRCGAQCPALCGEVPRMDDGHFGLFSYFSQVIWGFSATPNAHFGLFAHFITQHEKMHPTVRQKWLLDSKINANVQQR